MNRSFNPQVDDVRTFPSLTMPTPLNHSINQSKFSARKITNKQSSTKRKLYNSVSIASRQGSVDLFPGVLKTSKASTASISSISSGDTPAFVGFNASNLVFDGNNNNNALQNFLSRFASNTTPIEPQRPTLSFVDFSGQSSLPGGEQSIEQKQQSTLLTNSLMELRNYSVLMDQYSLHNFLIWHGKALKNTPEFQSFRRTYDHDWGPISSVIAAMEQMMMTYGVKLAIVNGQKTAEYALCGLPYYDEGDLLNCITNYEQIKPMISSCVNDGGATDRIRAVIKIQSIIRQCLARRRYTRLRLGIKCAVKIQSAVRMFLCRCRAIGLIGHARIAAETLWEQNRLSLKRMWAETQRGQPKLFIHIPSILAQETARLDAPNLGALENSHISCLHQLADPDVHIAYICPTNFGVAESTYHERFLQALGIPPLPKRLRFLVPEMVNRLRPEMPLAQILWYCSATLRRLRALAAQYSCVVIISNTVGWAEKRISNFLRVPILSPDVAVADMLSGPSFSKQVFMDAQVNIPLGAHDVSSEEDLMLTIARLLASNLDVSRWMIRLNHDLSNETVAYFDVGKLSAVKVLRAEQAALMSRHGGEIEPWFSKHVQASARKRLLIALEAEFTTIVKICRTDIFGSWNVYLKYLTRFGAVLEAEPPAILGHIEGLCFIDPLGTVHGIRGTDTVLDDLYQPVAYSFPQTSTPQPALEGATLAIANQLHEKWGVVGFVQTSFVSFWDSHGGVPKMWALKVHFGMSAAFGGVGTLSAAVRELDSRVASIPASMPSASLLNSALLPAVPEGRCCIYVPTAVHLPLRSSRDDVFFRQCRMNGIAYDPKQKLGTLFFLVDAIVGGVVSVMCVGSTKVRTLEIAVDALSFIANNFGRDYSDHLRVWNDLTSIVIRMRHELRREKARDGKMLTTLKSLGQQTKTVEEAISTVNTNE